MALGPLGGGAAQGGSSGAPALLGRDNENLGVRKSNITVKMTRGEIED